MKTAVYFEHNFPTWKTMILGAFLGLSVASCADQNFDWEDAKSQKVEYTFRSNFEKLVGEISPDQSWDFSTENQKTLLTRAIDLNDPRVSIVDGDTICKNVLTETVTKKFDPGNLQNQILPKNILANEGKEQPDSKGLKDLKPFVLVSSGNFKIAPVWRGVCDQKYSLLIIGQNPYTGHSKVYEQDFNSVMHAATDTDTGGRDNKIAIQEGAAHANNLGWELDFAPGTIITFALKSENGNVSYLTLDATPLYDVVSSSKGNYSHIVFMDDSFGDKDFNDLVFLVETSGTPPTPVTKTETKIGVNASKRYMVEDLGSTAASDIDFNDVVIDLKDVTLTKITTETTGGYSQSKITVEKAQTAQVWAMGGTLDFQFLLKTKDEDGKDQYKIIYHKEPHFIHSKMINTNPTELTTGGYNKPQSSDMIISGWDPEANNVAIAVCRDKNKTFNDVLAANDKSESEEGDILDLAGLPTDDIQILDFPEIGETPFIIAFDTNKQWRDERHAICRHWLYNPNITDGMFKCTECESTAENVGE